MLTGGGGTGDFVRGKNNMCARSATGSTWSALDTHGAPKARPGHGVELDHGGEPRHQWRGRLRWNMGSGDNWGRKRSSPGGARWPLGGLVAADDGESRRRRSSVQSGDRRGALVAGAPGPIPSAWRCSRRRRSAGTRRQRGASSLAA